MTIWTNTKDPRIKKRGENYWARFSIQGSRIEKNLNTKNFGIALQVIEKISAEIILGKSGIDNGKSLLFKDAWPKFLRDKESGVYSKASSAKTLKEYREFGERYFLQILDSKRVDRFSVDDFTEYIKELKTKFPNITRFENHYKYLSSFLSWADRKELTKRKIKLYNPDLKIKAEEDDDGKGRVYSDTELHAILDASFFEPSELMKKREQKGYEPKRSEGVGFALWVHSMTYQGMRRGEINQLLKDRIDLKAGVISLRKKDTKTRQARTIRITKEVMPLLIAQIAAYQDSEYLFPNRDDIDRPMDPGGFDKRWRGMLKELEIEGTPHELRHTYATKIFARADISPFVICKSLGMSMRTAERYYIHFDEDQLKVITERFSVL
jgi:integrase